MGIDEWDGTAESIVNLLYDEGFLEKKNVNEIRVNRPTENYEKIASRFKIPSGWTEEDMWEEEDDENERIIEFSAPMEGWDDNHKDHVWIEKTPEGKFIINGYIPYADFDTIECNTFKEAMVEMIEIMKSFKEGWDHWEEEDEDENNED
jgi:hypothetical protein